MNYKIAELLSKRPMHLRGIAKELFENPATIYKQMFEMERTGLVTSKKDGKRKVFFLNTLNPLADAYIRLADAEEKVNRLGPYAGAAFAFLKMLASAFGERRITAVIVFGSVAGGQWEWSKRKRSDLDLLVVIDSLPSDIHERTSLFRRLGLQILADYNIRVHVAPYDMEDIASPDPLLEEAGRKGICIFRGAAK